MKRFRFINLGLICALSPIEFLAYRLSASTLLYCLLWLGMFVLGDHMSFSLAGGRRLILAQKPGSTVCRRQWPTHLLSLMSLLGMAGIAGILVQRGFLSPPLDLGAMRSAFVYEGSSGLRTVVTIWLLADWPPALLA